ncbi:MAG: cytochrome d ubiquinol oxidase subunit II [Alphaproteobacteria bacterium]
MDLALLSAAVIALGVLVYTVLDGFDLGIGVLFAVAPDAGARATMMNSIAPVWDGNETWLVLGGAVLFAAFPLAYAVALPAFYIPLMAMLFALIFRGVSFELRFKSDRPRLWDWAFGLGSAVAAFAQGVLLGGLVQGVKVSNNAFAGGSFDWLTPLGIAAGFGVMAGYALLAACWLVLKTEGALQAHARSWGRWLVVAVLAAMGIVSLITPLDHPEVAARWFGGWNFLFLAPVPAAAAVAALILWRGLGRGWERAPFFLGIVLFILGYAGIGISLWPFIVPYALTIWQAAAPPSSQVFTLIGVAVSLPMVAVYMIYAYRVFRGKVRAGEGYGESH